MVLDSRLVHQSSIGIGHSANTRGCWCGTGGCHSLVCLDELFGSGWMWDDCHTSLYIRSIVKISVGCETMAIGGGFGSRSGHHIGSCSCFAANGLFPPHDLSWKHVQSRLVCLLCLTCCCLPNPSPSVPLKVESRRVLVVAP